LICSHRGAIGGGLALEWPPSGGSGEMSVHSLSLVYRHDASGAGRR